jgi:RNA polymerase sigma-70 factor (ECF subfamily)
MPPTTPVPSEKELVRRARNGDVNAFERILGQYQERVMRVVMSILKDPMDAEEVTQDVFMTVFDKVDTFRSEASLSTWIHRIAVNAALMRKRRQRPRVDLPLEEVLADAEGEGHLTIETGDWSDQVDDPVLHAEARQVIEQAIEKLDDKYQAVFALREVQGFSTAETAQILGLGVSAIKTRLHRARLFLREALAAYFDRQIPARPPGIWSPAAGEAQAL